MYAYWYVKSIENTDQCHLFVYYFMTTGISCGAMYYLFLSRFLLTNPPKNLTRLPFKIPPLKVFSLGRYL